MPMLQFYLFKLCWDRLLPHKKRSFLLFLTGQRCFTRRELGDHCHLHVHIIMLGEYETSIRTPCKSLLQIKLDFQQMQDLNVSVERYAFEA